MVVGGVVILHLVNIGEGGHFVAHIVVIIVVKVKIASVIIQHVNSGRDDISTLIPSLTHVGECLSNLLNGDICGESTAVHSEKFCGVSVGHFNRRRMFATNSIGEKVPNSLVETTA